MKKEESIQVAEEDSSAIANEFEDIVEEEKAEEKAEEVPDVPVWSEIKEKLD